MSRIDDEKLKLFLKENAPVAPAPMKGELESLMRELDLSEESTSTRHVARPLRSSYWIGFGGGAIAAGIVAAWVFVAQPFQQVPSDLSAVEVVATADFEVDATGFDDEVDDTPASEVGEEYLTLIADN